jgi:phosphoenolpyruvate carboxykinase (GTP)
VRGVVYGGRDPDCWVPVEQAFDWQHGVITKGASLESEATAATIGAKGARRFDPMSNLDFVSIPIGDYIRSNLEFAKALEQPPTVFGVNYFLKGPEGELLTTRRDKKVWLKWAERRIHGEVQAIRTPTGMIPLYRDLRHLFQEHLGEDYSPEDYTKQFMMRIPEHLAKIDRIVTIYSEQVSGAPALVLDVLEAQRERLEAARAKMGDYISPFDL